MIYLFIAVSAGILFGTVLLWLSGYYSGQAISGSAFQETATNAQTLHRQLEAEQKKNRELHEKLKDHKAAAAAPPSPLLKTQVAETATTSATSSADDNGADNGADNVAEIARLTSEVTKLEGERDKALFELDNAKEELETVQDKLSKSRAQEKPTTLPKPQKRESQPHSVSEALDELQAELDMEKVAHQLVREDLAQVQSSREQLSEELKKMKRELEQVKKLAALQMSTETDKDGVQSGSRFKTMAIGMRSPAAAGSDQGKLQSELEKNLAEKEQLETELQRTRKELQLLKMRSERSESSK